MTTEVSLNKVYEEIRNVEKNMATKKQVESLVDSVEVLSNPDTMKQLADSAKDIKVGKVKEVSSVKDLL